MRRLTIFSAALASAAFVASAAQAVPGVATGNVNLRADATVNSPRLTTIPAGAAVEVHGCPSWCQVTFNGYTGWASSSYISTGYAGRDYDPGYDRSYSYYEPAPRVYVQPAPPTWGWYGGPVWHDRYSYYDRSPWWYERRYHRRPGVSFGLGFDFD
jgi:uncharacterized protein YraI